MSESKNLEDALNWLRSIATPHPQPKRGTAAAADARRAAVLIAHIEILEREAAHCFSCGAEYGLPGEVPR